MVQLPLDQGIIRYKENEERFQDFVNGDPSREITSSTGVKIPSLRKFLYDKNQEINLGAVSILALATEQADDAAESKAAAAASAAQAAQSAENAATFDPSTYYPKTVIDDNFYTKSVIDTQINAINGNVSTLSSQVTTNQTKANGAIESLLASVSALALELADVSGKVIGMTGGVADAFDDTTGVVLQTGGLDENTLLLISANGADGSTTFVDSSAYGRRVTPNGDAKISTAQSKFGGSSAAFDGTGDFLAVPSSPDMDLGTGDFTFDFWANLTAINQPYAALFSMNWSAPGSFLCSFVSGKVSFYLSNAGVKLQEQVALAANTWTHYAIVRKDGVMTMYKNGISQASVIDTQSATASGQPLYVGSSNTGDSVFNGFIDEFRMSNVARWTDNFTPPTSGYTQNASESQNASYDAVNDNFRGSLIDPSTRCLLHFDGANGSKKIVDEVGARIWAASGDAQISTVQSKFGGACLAFDGTGDWIETTDFSDFRFGLGDFTVEFFVRTATPAASQTIFESRSGSNQVVPAISVASSKFVFIYNDVVRVNGSTTVVADTWYHVAISRSAGVTRLFVNGVLDGQFSDPTVNYGINKCRIGASYNGTSPFNGFIDEFRISQVGRYTANFAPPASAFEYKRKNLTLLSQAFSAGFVPASGRLVVQTLEVDTITVNTDLIGELSRDNGVTWTPATLALSSNRYGVKSYEGLVSLDAQPSGSTMRWRAKSANNKNVAISGISAQWRP